MPAVFTGAHKRLNIIGAVVLVLGVARVFAQPWLFHVGPIKYWGPPVDFQVYRYGGGFLVDGTHLYDGNVPTINDGQILPFTYPPFSALVFAPLSWLPVRVGAVIMAIAGCLVVWWLIRLLLRRVGCGDLPIGWSMILTAVALQMEPVRITLDLGQVNLLLVALMVADTIWDRRPAWLEPYRGLMVGFAAAIKLTPAVIVIYYLARRQWRAAFNVGLGFLLFSGIAWAITPSDSHKYWTSTLFDADRIGGLAFAYNQGIAGVLARMGLSESDRSHWWLLFTIVAAIYCLVLARVLANRGEVELCLLVASAVALLGAPAAWIHHWVLTSVFILVFLVVGIRARDRVFIGLGVLGLVAQLPGPSLFLPKTGLKELDWNWWQVIYGDLSLIWLLVVLAGAWWLSLTRVQEKWRRTPFPAPDGELYR
ncbi:glycosyltransferase 87 family protein [Gordonia sp. NPDC003585]|uniref:glycosyltransferase 87 family protein n=1 Tax=Gordonia sp. NPDC003585 TaxID=3154275 RepID=UPI0033A00618